MPWRFARNFRQNITCHITKKQDLFSQKHGSSKTRWWNTSITERTRKSSRVVFFVCIWKLSHLPFTFLLTMKFCTDNNSFELMSGVQFRQQKFKRRNNGKTFWCNQWMTVTVALIEVPIIYRIMINKPCSYDLFTKCKTLQFTSLFFSFVYRSKVIDQISLWT